MGIPFDLAIALKSLSWYKKRAASLVGIFRRGSSRLAEQLSHEVFQKVALSNCFFAWVRPEGVDGRAFGGAATATA